MNNCRNTHIDGIPGVCTFEISNDWDFCAPYPTGLRWFKRKGIKSEDVFEITFDKVEKNVDTSIKGLVSRQKHAWAHNSPFKCVFTVENISKHPVVHMFATDTLDGGYYSVYTYAIKDIIIDVMMRGPRIECAREVEAIMRTLTIRDFDIHYYGEWEARNPFYNRNSFSNMPFFFTRPSGILGVGSLVIPATWRSYDIGETCVFEMDTYCASLSKTDISIQPIEISRHTENHALLEAYANMERDCLESYDDTYKESRNWESLYRYTTLHIVGVSLKEHKVTEKYVYVQGTMIVTVAVAWEYDNVLAAKFARMVLKSYYPDVIGTDEPLTEDEFLLRSKISKYCDESECDILLPCIYLNASHPEYLIEKRTLEEKCILHRSKVDRDVLLQSVKSPVEYMHFL